MSPTSTWHSDSRAKRRPTQAQLAQALPIESIRKQARTTHRRPTGQKLGRLSSFWPYLQTIANMYLAWKNASTIQTEFSLQLQAGESISQVLVEASDGAQRELPTSGWTYDDATGTLTVDRSAITGTDSSLSVEVTSACIPDIE